MKAGDSCIIIAAGNIQIRCLNAIKRQLLDICNCKDFVIRNIKDMLIELQCLKCGYYKFVYNSKFIKKTIEVSI